DPARYVRVKYFEEISELLALGFFPECFESQERFPILLEFINKSDGVKPQVRPRELLPGSVALELAALNLVNGGRAEGLRRFAGITPVTNGPNVGRIVCPRRGRDGRRAKETFLDRQLFADVRRHEHDVDQTLLDYFPDDVEKLGQVAITEL